MSDAEARRDLGAVLRGEYVPDQESAVQLVDVLTRAYPDVHGRAGRLVTRLALLEAIQKLLDDERTGLNRDHTVRELMDHLDDPKTMVDLGCVGGAGPASHTGGYGQP